MAGTTKSNSERTSAAGAAVSAPEPLGEIVRKGIESLVTLQKQALDMAAGQGAIAVGAMEASSATLTSGLSSAVNWGFQAVAATEKSLLDLAATQQSLAMNAAAPLLSRFLR